MILVLSDLWLPFPGGAERLMFNIARDLMRRAHDTRVLTGYGRACRFDGPPVEVQPIQVFDRQPEGAAMVTEAISLYQPSVIVTHHLYAFQFERELVDSGVPLVQIVLNGHRIPEAAVAVYISQWVRDNVGGDKASDIVLTPPAYADVIASTHGECIGFIKPIPHKGVDLVYRIAERMPRRRFLVLRGEWQTLETIRRLPNVTYMEPVDDIRDFYSQCRMVLVPSRSEDAGTVAQEATMNNLPCLSTAVGGLAETNAGGVLLEPDATLEWVKAITDLDDPERYAQVVASQRAALSGANHRHTMDVLARRVADLI